MSPFTLILALGTSVAAASETGDEEHGAEPSEMAHHAYHRHHLAVFNGVTFIDSGPHYTLGIEYEYRLPWLRHRLGINPVLEHVFDAGSEATDGEADSGADETLAFVTAFFHPYRGLELFLGPGLGFVHGEVEPEFRVGTGYDFHLGDHLGVAPTVSVDLTRDHAFLVAGVVLGVGL